jgi:putative hydrolase of the HAD superfamily
VAQSYVLEGLSGLRQLFRIVHFLKHLLMKKPRVIFFDAVGTLFEIRGTVGEIYGRFAQREGLKIDAKSLDRAFLRSFRAAPRAAFTGADPQDLSRLEYEWWRSVAYESFNQVGALSKIENFDAFFQPLFDYFAIADPWFLYSEVPKVLSELKSLGLELAIISNFDSRLYVLIEVLGLEQWFSSITLSTQVGAAKPERAIFEAALAIYGYSPEQAWHIGDSWTEDYQGATAAGLQGVWLNRSSHQDLQADIAIDTLSALQSRLNP